jgi:hypothetical protein
MVPATVGGVVVLLLLVVPGIWYELLRQRYRPGRDDSAFIEISRILMAGVVISGLAITVLALVRLLGPRMVADIGSLVSNPAYFGQHLHLVGLTLVFFMILSLTIAPIWVHLTATKGLQSGVRPESAWVTAFSRVPAEAAHRSGFEWRGHVDLEVHLSGGAPPLRGRLAGYSTQLELEDRELTLGIPLTSFDHASKSWRPVDSDAGTVSLIVLRASEIAQIRTIYTMADAAADTAPTSPWASAARPFATLMSTLDSPLSVVTLLGVELAALLAAAGIDRALIG